MSLSPATTEPLSARTGVLFAFAGGLTISFDIPLLRLAGTDPHLTLVARGAALALFGLMAARIIARAGNAPARPWRDFDFLLVSIGYGLSGLLFTLAVYRTSAANLVFILAFNPLLAALFSWLFIGERPNVRTWFAMALTVLGVGIIFHDSLGTGTLVGDSLALGCTAALALALTWSRRSGKNMALAPSAGGLLVMLYALPLIPAGALAAASPTGLGYLALNACLVLPLASFLLATAPRYISASRVAMFYLLETILAPIWVWLIFFEVPTTQTLIGGALVLTAIAWHNWQPAKPNRGAPA
ncbi:MAG: DMT family transporter [Pseudomonadota bacterium]